MKNRTIYQRILASFWLLIVVIGTALPVDAANVKQSPNDQREYRTLTLDNGLEVLLVSDVGNPRAAAALSVGVGSFQDPKLQQGLAHYLEHVLLFRGSKQYPDSGDYFKYIAENAGVMNGSTWTDHTSYMFEVDGRAFDGALARWSDAFIEPLLDKDANESELSAVHSEWEKSYDSDLYAINRVAGITLNSAHPATNFIIGNKQSLSDKPGSPLQQELKQFYQRYYRAENMKLVLLSGDNLNILEAKAKKYFSKIKPGKRQPLVDAPIFPAKNQRLLRYQSKANKKLLALEFVVDNNLDQFANKPNAYIAHLLSSLESGTLYSQLIERGWITSLEVILDLKRYGHKGSVNLIFDLTKDGLDRRDQIVADTLAYIELLNKLGVKEKYYRELTDILKREFELLKKSSDFNYVATLSEAMLSYPLEHVIDHNYVVNDFDEKIITSALAQLNVNNMRALYVDQKQTVNTQLQYYPGSYDVSAIDKPLKHWLALATKSKLALPAVANESVQLKDRITTVLEQDQIALVDLSGDKVWFKNSNFFSEPEGVFWLSFNSPLGNASAKNQALACVLADVYAMKMLPTVARAQKGGVNISLQRLQDNTQAIVLSGLVAKQEKYLQKMVMGFIDLKIGKGPYKQALQRCITSTEEVVNFEPPQQLYHYMQKLLFEPNYSEQDLLLALEKTSLEDVRSYHQELASNNLLRGFAFGDYNVGTVKTMLQTAKNTLPEGREQTEFYQRKYLQPKSGQLIQANIDYDKTDMALFDVYLAKKASVEQYAHLLLINPTFNNMLFSQLRGKESLAYSVSSMPLNFHGYAGLGLFIQSSVKDLPTLKQRFDKFRQDFGQQLPEVGELYSQLQAAVLTELSADPKNLYEEAARYFVDFEQANYQFDTYSRMRKETERASLADIVASYKEIMLDKPTNAMVQLRGKSFKEKPFAKVATH